MKNAPTSTHKSTFAEKLAWGAGGMTESLVNSIFALSFPIYSIALGVNSTLVGIAQSLPRLVDAFTDPIMGNISDNTRSRFGRRRPYILIGAILCGLILPLIFRPDSGWGQYTLFVWYASLTVLFFLAYTIWSIPWGALGLEMSDDYNDRTSIQVSRMIFSTLANLGVVWAYKLCFFFDADELIGVRPVSLILGGVMLGAGVMSALCIKEWRQVEQQTKMKLIPAMRMTLSNRPFLLVCATVLFFAGGVIMVEPMLLYVNIYYVYGGDRDLASTIMGVSGSVGVVTSVVLLPFGGWMANRLGKRHAVFLALGLIIAGKGSQYFLVTPESPYLQLLPRIVFSPGIVLMWALIPSMIADICDLDELETGRRREAIYTAAFQWIWKMGGTLAMVMAGLLLSLVGANVSEPGVMLDETTVQRLRICLAVVPPLLGCLGLICIWKYPLTAERIDAIKARIVKS